MGNTMYLECYSGISGDMAVAALLDLGADQTVLEKALNSLLVKGFETEISRVKKAGLDVCDFRVKLDREHENHDHDMRYLHGEKEHLHGEHDHTHEEHDHTHGEHDHTHGEHAHTHEEHAHSHAHEHRGLPEILDIIGKAEMSERAKKLAARIFEILAEAEAEAHGVPLEQVHFHEVGAVDSIVDIVSAAVCIDSLDISEVIVPELWEGRGFVRCQHGVIPVPVPAVVNIAKTHQIELHLTGTEGELVTPTGAAIVAAVRTSDRLPEKFSVQRVGIGAGKRNYDRPSLLRAMLIEKKEESNENQDMIYCLETNIDDCSGETLGYVMEQLLKNGARDVYYTPIYMKKNRPAYQLNVICMEEEISKMEEILFHETTTIGIRRTRMERTILPRKIYKVQTSEGEASVKVCSLPDGERRVYPEYADVAALAEQSGSSFREVYGRIRREAEEWILKEVK